MRKIFIIALASLVLLSFSACNSAEDAKTPYSSDEETTSTIDLSFYEEIEDSFDGLKKYRKRVSVKEFNTEFSDSNTFNPVVFNLCDELILWYSTPNGNICTKTVYPIPEISTHYLDWNIHYPSDITDEIIYSSTEFAYTYESETGEIKRWEFGKELSSHMVPAESIYCGKSNFEGFLFRSGTDVYAFREKELTVDCIAHNVEYVISATYRYGSDPCSQPLFKMTDGSIMAYISWEADEGVGVDHESHLHSLKVEGEYR